MKLSTLHKKSINNREYIESSRKVGCFYCLKLCKPIEVISWADKETTGLCPNCGIDALIGDSVIDLSKTLLEDLHLQYFKNTVK